MERISEHSEWDKDLGTMIVYEVCALCGKLLDAAQNDYVLDEEKYFHAECFEKVVGE